MPIGRHGIKTASFGVCARRLRLAEGVRLRREHFGGLAFQMTTGTTVDLDREAFTLISDVQAEGIISEDALLMRWGAAANSRTASPATTREVIWRLLELGVLREVASPFAQIESKAPGSTNLPQGEGANTLSGTWPEGSQLSAPETVHWALTYRCEANCPDCYATRHRKRFSKELDTREAMHVMERIAAWGVFQLAFGGGEPLLRRDLTELAAYARGIGFVVHLTTGVEEIDDLTWRKLARGVTTVQIGVKPERLLAQPLEEVARLQRLVVGAKEVGLPVGANLMLSASVMRNFLDLVLRLTEAGFMRFTLLRYKPPASATRWRTENPTPEAMGAFEKNLPKILARQGRALQWRIDCALGFLQRRLAPVQALVAGIRGCAAASRIVALAPDGSVFPCSQLVAPALLAGNILADEPTRLWAEAIPLQRYRGFRATDEFMQSACGICGAREQCGGCRALAEDALGGDSGCPGPLFPPRTQPGGGG
ncbi:MAG: radical SAM protein [Firmicutes bacterium]|nr:radical SAM protein [Bacillota bacterium]